jgi:outer membrane protein
MAKSPAVAELVLVAALGCMNAIAQSAPASADKVWHSKAEQSLDRDSPHILKQIRHRCCEDLHARRAHRSGAAAQSGDARRLGTSKGARRITRNCTGRLLSHTYCRSLGRNSAASCALVGEYFHRQTIGLFEPTLHVDYLVFDFGGRSGAIDVAKANLLIANLEFNNTHRSLSSRSLPPTFACSMPRDSARLRRSSLKNAQAIEDDAQSRLDNGLATKPDVLEASAARAQADYDLQAAIGAEDIAQGDLATSMGLPAETKFQVQDIHELAYANGDGRLYRQEIDRAFAQRPELMQQVARVRSAQGALKQARSAYVPTIGFSGDGGLARGYGQQDLYPGHYAQGEYWNVGLQMKWTLFDGMRREHEVAEAKAEKRAAEASIDALARPDWQRGVDSLLQHEDGSASAAGRGCTARLLQASLMKRRASLTVTASKRARCSFCTEDTGSGPFGRCSRAHAASFAGCRPRIPHRRSDSDAAAEGSAMN